MNNSSNRKNQTILAHNICRYIENCSYPPSLSELSREFNLSQYHLQRLFKEALGISPKQYAEQSRQQRLKQQLKANNCITTALYASGYNSSSALYSNISKKIGMTPKHYKKGGANLLIYFSISDCPLGKLLVASTTKGICMVSLDDHEEPLYSALMNEFPQAEISRDDKYLLVKVRKILKYLQGQEPSCDLPLDVQGTAFQKRVWEELKRISHGTTASYNQIAQRIGKPKAIRAVANACANNPVSLIIPCHRVIRKDGHLGGYRWHLKRKEALLSLERKFKYEEKTD